MEASVKDKPEDKTKKPLSKTELPEETDDKVVDGAVVEDEPEVEEVEQDDTEADKARLEAEAELDKLDPLVEVVEYTIGKPPGRGGEPNEYSIYVQQPLGYISCLRFYGLIGKTVAEAIKAGGAVDLGDAFNNTGGNLEQRAKQIMEQSFNDAGSFAALLFQLIAYSPDFILEFYCVALDIPNTERRWAKAVMEQPWRPDNNKWGLQRSQGQDIIERFIDQNYDEVRDFFGDLIGNINKRVRKNEKRRKSTSGQSK